jgi:hypothetical protein
MYDFQTRFAAGVRLIKANESTPIRRQHRLYTEFLKTDEDAALTILENNAFSVLEDQHNRTGALYDVQTATKLKWIDTEYFEEMEWCVEEIASLSVVYDRMVAEIRKKERENADLRLKMQDIIDKEFSLPEENAWHERHREQAENWGF